MSERRSVLRSHRAKCHVLENQREVEQVVIETSSRERDLRICQEPSDLGKHVPLHGRRVQGGDEKKQQKDSAARNHAEKTEPTATV
jgi:hypothetical protein